MFMPKGLTLAVVAIGAQLASAAEIKLLGAITGQVRNEAGVAQMGATVTLVNRLERTLERTLTDPQGRFRFDGLFPDAYGIRVTASSFVPAYRGNVLVKSGIDSFLTVQLAHIFSSIELVYRPAGQTGLLTDDWKYTLRASGSTRPVLRMVEVKEPAISTSRNRNSPFSATRGVVAVSAGDMAGSSPNGQEADLGTAFALGTSVYGRNHIELSGALGYSSGWGTPTGGFRTRYRRTGSNFGSPDIELTVRQASYRGHAGAGFLGGFGGGHDAPLLRTMSIKVEEKTQIGDHFGLEYGGLAESVAFTDRLTILSPFARASFDTRTWGSFLAAYSSGATPTSLLADARRGITSEQEALTGLGVFPRVSLRNGQVRVQGTDTLEVGYRKSFGKHTVGAAAFLDNIRDPALALGGLNGYSNSWNLMPDLASDSVIVNMGSYRSRGYVVTGERTFGDHAFAAVYYGQGDALEPTSLDSIGSAPELRSNFHPVRRRFASARIGGIVPKSGTFFSSSYGWAEGSGLAPYHASLTQRYQPLMGLNFQVRQSLPALGMPGRLEMNAELRNLLAQGYVPIGVTAGGNLVLMQFPRTIRGGLSFIF